MTEAEQRWVDQANYDLDTARAMLVASRYIYVLFCCQQAVEKALKAKIVGLTGELPPRIHNLLRLAGKAGIDLPEEQAQFSVSCRTFMSNRVIPKKYRQWAQKSREIRRLRAYP